MPFAVYTLSDPRTGSVRYVGKTVRSLDTRLKDHLAPKNLRPHTHKNCWIKSLKDLGLKPVIELVEETVDVNEAERFYISYFRFLGFDLTNATDGGEGILGLKRPPRSAEWCARLGAAHRGKTISPEQRLQISAVHKGRPKGPFTAEHRANISKAARARKKAA